jgi:hypothetical protein
MALNFISDCRFTGPAFSEAFVRFDLEGELNKLKLLAKRTGDEGKDLDDSWESYRRSLRELASQGGSIRVKNVIIEPLMSRLGYDKIDDSEDVETREGKESGGCILRKGDSSLRVWTTSFAEDIDAPVRRGRAYRFSHLKIAQRVMLAKNERVGLITNGVELRLLISDPARTDSQVEIPLETHWKRSREVPDSYILFLALASPGGVKAIPDLIEKARLKQSGVTKELRKQARQAVELFTQDILEHPENQAVLSQFKDKEVLAKQLWHEGLINIFRMLFVLKLESTDDPARAFSFASTSLWRNTYSPSVAMAKYAREILDNGTQTGFLLEGGMRSLFRMFTEGLSCTELNVRPLGGALFGEDSTPLISKLKWGEMAVAHLLDRLLWTPRQKGSDSRERVHYGALSVGDLGRVYESLIELDSGITTEPMCRLRRSKLEVVVPLEQGIKYKKTSASENIKVQSENEPDEEGEDTEEESSNKKTKIEWIEEIPANHFYLRVGLGRKASGSYYTPDSFVKFLVQETLEPICNQKSPKSNPHPMRILEIKVADIAMGSGHFLFEACEFLGAKLYESCRLCDELAMQAEQKGESAKDEADKKKHLIQAHELWKRVQDLPDPNDELMAYLPSRAAEDGKTAYSIRRAEAICKRLVAVHCLYGVDRNPLAVELARLSLWIETHAEGMPLTFLDHRFVIGDSLTGPSLDNMMKFPGSQEKMDDLFTLGLKDKFSKVLQAAFCEIRNLEASVGKDIPEIEAKISAKERLDKALAPFKTVAAAWTGGVMLGGVNCDDISYGELVKAVSAGGDISAILKSNKNLSSMIDKGRETVPFELAFPDVFFRTGDVNDRSGFDVILGNPPWDRIEISEPEFWASFDLRAIAVDSKRERDLIIREHLKDNFKAESWKKCNDVFEEEMRSSKILFRFQSSGVGGGHTVGRPDLYRLFSERGSQLLTKTGSIGFVLPSAFHANEGATGIRRLYLENMNLRYCYSFENRKKLFEIDSRFKFALVVAEKSGITKEFRCGFYLHDDEWLFSDRTGNELIYTLDFVQITGGEHLTFVECKSQIDADITLAVFKNSKSTLKDFLQTLKIKITGGLEIHRAPGTVFPIGDSLDSIKGWQYGENNHWLKLPVVEGKSFHQFTDCWEPLIREYAVVEKIIDKSHWGTSCKFYRLAMRTIASSTNERSIIVVILPSGFISNHSVLIETFPDARQNYKSLRAITIFNTFVFDWMARNRIGANINQFIINPIPVAEVKNNSFLSHSALRLSCNHTGYAPLWTEQLGDEWLEPRPKHTWPVLKGDDERWAVRAAIDAVVAEAYGLNREQYQYVLSTFSHKSYPKAPELCLAMFDELKKIGIDAFTKKHDPYWDIPLNESLPRPVIELPIPEEVQASEEGAKAQRGKGTKKTKKSKDSSHKQETFDF